MLGDWLGARTWLEDRGVFPSVTFVTDALGNPTGGKEQGFKGSFEISFSKRFGTSLSIENIGNVFSVQQVFGGETYRLVDVAYRQRLLDGRVEFRVGRIAAGDDFLVSPSS